MSNELTAATTGQQIEGADVFVQTGQWYWVRIKQSRRQAQPEYLGCVIAVGSNYATLAGVFGEEHRIHFAEFDEICQAVSDPVAALAAYKQQAQNAVQETFREIRELLSRLGVVPQQHLPHTADTAATDSNTALSVVSRQADIPAYKQQLLEAKDTTLPALQQELKRRFETYQAWLGADLLPVKAENRVGKGIEQAISARLYSVGLYAGLEETAQALRSGLAASITEPIHIMRGMRFMDEECLAEYRVGGIEFDTLAKFDRWLLRKRNFQRLFPHPKTVVAFRVRRYEKSRESDSLWTSWVNLLLAEYDRLTFLYVRNGQQLHRLSTDYDFGVDLLGDAEDCDFSTKVWGHQSSRRDGWSFVTDARYRRLRAERAERIWQRRKWARANPDKHSFDNPFDRGFNSDSVRDYHPFDKSSVYYDDMLRAQTQQMQRHNQLVLILQGLLDRSTVLHPHPPIVLWQEGFSEMLRFVDDTKNVLHDGDPPDFEAFRQACNQSLQVGSVTIGQQQIWLQREAEKENDRRNNDWQSRRSYSTTLKEFQPYGDPGPGMLAQVVAWNAKKRLATFRWRRQRRRATWRTAAESTGDTITVPADLLFNASAYQAGDFKQFYVDPRTRRNYLKWAHTLLTAEEFAAGNVKPGTDIV